jgi:hypothetical protein
LQGKSLISLFSSSAEDLFLYNNNFVGSIPSVIGQLDLERVQIQRNSFNGNIPTQLVANENLRELRLDNNMFTGELPSMIGNLDRLNDLRVSFNNLMGELPASFAALTSLGRYSLIVRLALSNSSLLNSLAMFQKL